MKKIITEQELSTLRSYAKENLTDNRYMHTIAVEEEVARLAQIYCPEKIMELRAAAILHDITKEYKTEIQLKMCEKYGIIVESYDSAIPKVFHSKTGAALAADLFPDIVNEEIQTAIRLHTTGDADMSIADKLLYLADYIEPTRKFKDCALLRKYFYSDNRATDFNMQLLDDTLLYSFDLTIKDLIKDKKPISPQTINARNYLCIKRMTNEIGDKKDI